MTQDEIIRLAREAADVLTDVRGREEFIFDDHGIVSFAALVAEATKEKASKVCEEALIAAEKKLRKYAESEEGEYNLGRTNDELELDKAWPEEVYVVREAIASIRRMK